jgi:hypothetical protein
VTTPTILGQQCTMIKTDGKAPPIFWAIQSDYLLATVGEDSFKTLLERTGNEIPAWLQAAHRRLPVPRRSLVAYADVTELGSLIHKTGDPQAVRVWSELGLADVSSVSYVGGLDERGYASRGLIATKKYNGILSLFASQPLTKEAVSIVPGNALAGGVMRFSPKHTYATIRKIVGQIDPESAVKMDAGLASLQESTGIQLADLLSALGDTWSVYHAGSGLMGIPELVVSVSVHDRAALEDIHEKFLEFIRPLLAANADSDGLQPSIAETTISGHKSFYLKGLPIAPTWCISDSHLTIAISTQALKTHFARRPSAKSLADQPQVAERLAAGSGPLAIYFNDTRKGLQSLYTMLPTLANLASGELSKRNIEFDPSVIPAWETISEHIQPSVYSVHRGEHGIEFYSQETIPVASVSGVGTPVAVLLLLPAVNAARAAARRAHSLNQLRQIALAIANFEAAMGRLPAASIKTAQGKPGLSWRVKILPYLEENELYKEFRLDEPWDSEHNKKLIAKLPECFRSPVSQAEAGKTNYLAVRGANSVIAETNTNQGIRTRDIKDGTSRTIMLVEVNDDRAVTWTKPDDYEWTAENPAQGMGDLHPGEIFLAAFADCSVRVFERSIDKDSLKAMYTRSGREPDQPAP